MWEFEMPSYPTILAELALAELAISGKAYHQSPGDSMIDENMGQAPGVLHDFVGYSILIKRVFVKLMATFECQSRLERGETGVPR